MAYTCQSQPNCILRWLNKVCGLGDKKQPTTKPNKPPHTHTKPQQLTNLIFIRHLSYTYIWGMPSCMPLRWHNFITGAISQLALKHCIMKSHSPLLQSAGGGRGRGKTSKLNPSAAQVHSLHFKRRLRNPLQNPVSGVHIKVIPNPVPLFPYIRSLFFPQASRMKITFPSSINTCKKSRTMLKNIVK